MLIRAIVVFAIVGLLGIHVVRNGVVQGLADNKPSAAANVWSDHPAVELSLGMTRIAEVTRAARPVPISVFRMMGDAALKEPLASEPFLVKGVQAQLSGDGAIAQRAFEAAQWRNPRSLPAALFLAQRYLQVGDVARGMREIALLARLSPGAVPALAPYLAAYAGDRRNWPALQALFRADPELANSALAAMAKNAASAPAVLALADPRQKAGEASWLQPLLTTLIEAGDYSGAREIWRRMSGVGAPGLLYDSSFTDTNSPPPFNWSLTSSTVGLAERQPGGRLHIVFYGREDGFLATQMLLLGAGQYRMSMHILGDTERVHSLNWSVWCDKAEAPIASVSLDVASARGWSFTVPGNCPAQWLKLSAVSRDVSQQVDTTIASLKLEKVAQGG